MAETRLGYRPALDGLRGVAVALVVAYHFDEDWLPGGWIGVDLFFVLSGFLITTLLLEERERHGGVWLSGFYQRRCLRLLPAMVAFLGVVAMWHAVDPSFMSGIRFWLPRVYLTNFTVAFGLGDAGFSHIWSLAAEEQFYLLWPPILVTLMRRRASRSTMVAVTAGLVAASTLASIVLWSQGAAWGRLYFGPDTHAAPILIGCLLGMLWHFDMLPARAELAAIPAVAALALVAVEGHPQERALYAGGLTIIGLAGAAVIVAALRVPWLTSCLSIRRMVTVGRYSYALYLWHPFLLFHARPHGQWWMTLAIVATYPLAALSMRLIESPFLALKEGASRPPVLDAVAPLGQGEPELGVEVGVDPRPLRS